MLAVGIPIALAGTVLIGGFRGMRGGHRDETPFPLQAIHSSTAQRSIGKQIQKTRTYLQNQKGKLFKNGGLQNP